MARRLNGQDATSLWHGNQAKSGMRTGADYLGWTGRNRTGATRRDLITHRLLAGFQLSATGTAAMPRRGRAERVVAQKARSFLRPVFLNVTRVPICIYAIDNSCTYDLHKACGLAELEQKAEPLLAEIDKTKRELALVKQLRQFEDGTMPARGAVGTIGDVKPDAPISDAAAAILKEAGRPLHISEIRERFLASGRMIPGQGTESNLLSHIVRDPRFARSPRGRTRSMLHGRGLNARNGVAGTGRQSREPAGQKGINDEGLDETV
jgi:hypothetical protein